MSHQHRKLAEVWITLQGRHDTSSILREIIGQHSIDSALDDDNSRSSDSCIQTIIWIKTIFDLQRCYLSGLANGVAECPPYVLSSLLPSELVLSSILFLVNVKTLLFPSQTTLITKDFTRPRHILAQTILSGLRLLLLRKESIAASDKRRLHRAISTAWQHDRLQGVERFIVSDLFAQILDTITPVSQIAARDTPSNPYMTEWQNARLPTFAAGLYPLNIQPETFVTHLIHGTMGEDWVDAYWVLFDCLWGIECAVTQRLVDIHRQTGISGSGGADTDEILEQLYHTRISLIISIFHVNGPITPPRSLFDSLALTLLDWNEDLDSFLSRQDSLLQQRASIQPNHTRAPSYASNVAEISPYFAAALPNFSIWLSARKHGQEQFTNRRVSGVTSDDMEEMVKEWITKMTAGSRETVTREPDGPFLPVYIVNCPKLHVVPKRFLEYKLRWCDKWAYESIQENSPIVNWKEGVHCPSCTAGERITFARLIEPFQHLTTALENLYSDDYSLSQYSVGDSSSYDVASMSFNSHIASEGERSAISLEGRSTMAISLPSQVSRPSEDSDFGQLSDSGHPPSYSESPISPTFPNPPAIYRSRSQDSSHIDYPVSPLNESLNIPIPLASRFSMELPIPVTTTYASESLSGLMPASAPSDISSIPLMNTPSTDSMTWSGASGTSVVKQKASSRTVRIANSIRRKPTSSKEKETFPLPKDPSFVFSASGHSLLLWGKGADYLVRFDIPSNDISAIQGCKYEIPGLEAAAAGNHKCAVIASSGLQGHRLVLFDGINLSPEYELDLNLPKQLNNISLAVSRNDKYVALSTVDQIQIFNIEDGIKLLPFHHQIHVYELKGGTSHRRTISIGRTTSDETITETHKHETGWFGVQARSLSSKEVAEEQRRQSAVVSRKLYFSTDSKLLAVATQLGDHCVYIDVWDCTREPVSTISEHSRSFKLPPWTLNDGDLTSVFYDSTRKSAIVTAFLGKEYPVLIPFPGYDALQNETYSTKIVHAAQSPSGLTFVVANAMTEIIQFEHTAKGTLSARRLKKSSAKISNSTFKPGAIALAMPLENVLQCFWIKDGKCMLRTVKIETTESFRDYDLRPHFERLMGLKKNPVIARAPSLLIPEMDAS